MTANSWRADPAAGADAASEVLAEGRVLAGPHYAWYGDDFTGASDTLATLAQAGLRTILFCGVPTAEQFRRAAPLDAFGIAGAARAMAPDAMRAELAAVGPFLAASGARVLHYKCCSTFDSAPHVGSIGVAVETLRRYCSGQPVLIVGGQPSLGRYCVFGELYAVAEQSGPVYRIDRHPTMSRHPVTPMHEADLRVHLGHQGLDRIALVDVRAHGTPTFDALVGDAFASRHASGAALLFDVTDDRELDAVGHAIWQHGRSGPVLVVGASSVAQSQLADWGVSVDARDPRIAPAKGPVLVLAGSLSPMTARQIKHASSYECIPLEPTRLATDRTYVREQADRVTALLRDGRHVLAYTTPTEHGHSSQPGDLSARIAPASAALLVAVLRSVRLSRVGIAGGDTSSHAVRALAPWGLDWVGRVDAGVPLLRARADDPVIDGLELMLKGGQMGEDRLFDVLVEGTWPIP